MGLQPIGRLHKGSGQKTSAVESFSRITQRCGRRTAPIPITQYLRNYPVADHPRSPRSSYYHFGVGSMSRSGAGRFEADWLGSHVSSLRTIGRRWNSAAGKKRLRSVAGRLAAGQFESCCVAASGLCHPGEGERAFVVFGIHARWKRSKRAQLASKKTAALFIPWDNFPIDDAVSRSRRISRRRTPRQANDDVQIRRGAARTTLVLLRPHDLSRKIPATILENVLEETSALPPGFR